MHDDPATIPFQLPREVLRKVCLRLLPWLAAGLVLPLFLGHGVSVGAMISSVLLVCAILAGTYWISLHFKWVRLSQHGIQGYSLRGSKNSIAWSEPVNIRASMYSGIKGMLVEHASARASVFLPSAIASTSQFQSALSRFAPAEHPLLASSKNAA